MENKDISYYSYERRDLLEIVPSIYGEVLDVGCGAGATIALLLGQKGVSGVTGIERSQTACEVAWSRNMNVIQANVQNDVLPFQEKHFDFILFGDILEHLYDPWTVLKKFRSYLKDNGTMLLSIPNVKHYKNLKRLLLHDEWTYLQAGVLDYTHIRFFTRKEAIKLVENSGMKIVTIRYRTNRNKIFRLLKWIFGDRIMTLWAEQFLLAAIKPGIDQVPG
jgi:methionine biosynthesis protein MetW